MNDMKLLTSLYPMVTSAEYVGCGVADVVGFASS